MRARSPSARRRRGPGRHADVGAGAGLVPRGQRCGGCVAGERLGQVVDDHGRSPCHLVDVAAGRRDDQRAAGVLGGRVVVEGEVAEAVVDIGRAEVAAAEQDVRMRAHNDVGARLHQHLGQWLLQGVGARIELGAPVQVDDHGVSGLARRLHGGNEVVHVVGRSKPGLGGGRRPGRLQVGVDDLGGGDDGDVLAVNGGRVRGECLRRVLADAEDVVARLGPRGEGHLQSGRPAVLAVVVGLRDQRHAGALEGAHGGRRRGEDVLLVLRLRAGAVRQRGLEVHHGEVDPRKEGRYGRPQGIGRVGGQPIPEVGPGREVHVPAEGEGDGLAVAVPVRIETGVPGVRRRGLVMVTPPEWLCPAADGCPLPRLSTSTRTSASTMRPTTQKPRLRLTRREVSPGTRPAESAAARPSPVRGV